MKSFMNVSLVTYFAEKVAGVLGHVGGDGLEEMGLPQPGPAVDEERVVRLRRRLGDRERGGVREPVRRADDERVERVLRVEALERARGPWGSVQLARDRRATGASRTAIRTARSSPRVSRTIASSSPRK